MGAIYTGSLRRSSLEKKFSYLAAAFGLAALLAVCALASEMVRCLEDQTARLDHSQDVLAQLFELAPAVVHMERWEREGEFSGAAASKIAYLAATQNAARAISQLERLVSEDAPLRVELRRWFGDLEAKRAALSIPITWNDEDRVDSRAWHQANTGWIPEIDGVQKLLYSIGQAERHAFESQSASEAKEVRSLRDWVWITSLAAFLLSGVLVILVRHEIAAQRRQNILLSATATELDATLRTRTAELMNANNSLRELSAHIEAAREDERLRIAREVHDDLGSTLTALKFELVGNGNTMVNVTGDIRRQRASVDLVDCALQTVQNVVAELRPRVLDQWGLWEALKWQAQQFEERRKIACRISLAPGLPKLSRKLSTAIFRIVEEALTNVARHADACSVEVAVRLHEANLEIKIRDDGRGITEEEILRSDAFGLLGMHERARLCGGEFHISGEARRGTTARLTVPFERWCHESSQA
jgi:signal transduction histidine kinase